MDQQAKYSGYRSFCWKLIVRTPTDRLHHPDHNVVRKKEQKGRSAPRMDGSVVFARWRQCVSHLIQCFLGSTQVHIQNGISIGSAVFAQLTAGSSHSLQWTAISPQKSFPGESGPHLIHDSLGLPESTTQTVSRSVQPFLHGSRS